MEQQQDKRLETALRLQKMELSIEQLRVDMEKNTKATENLLLAWNGSRSTVGFIKGCVIFVAAFAAAWGGVSKIWEH